jgi:hypothetical protein
MGLKKEENWNREEEEENKNSKRLMVKDKSVM